MGQVLDAKRSFISRGGLQLKGISKALLMAEALDVASTYTGFTLFPQMWEANPLLAIFGSWIPVLLAKAAATLFVVVILEKVEKWPPVAWIIPLTASLPILWNAVCIMAEFLA